MNELVGETIVILQSETALNDWTSEIEVYLQPQGTVPFSHIHRGYTEIFEVLEGQLSVELDGSVRVMGPARRSKSEKASPMYLPTHLRAPHVLG